jgi:hypothetical protein
VKHITSRSFWEHYGRLPGSIQILAKRAFQLLKANPRHPSLCFKKVGPYWTVRVGIHYRAVATRDDDEVTWFWIGHHAEYDGKV